MRSRKGKPPNWDVCSAEKVGGDGVSTWRGPSEMSFATEVEESRLAKAETVIESRWSRKLCNCFYFADLRRRLTFQPFYGCGNR